MKSTLKLLGLAVAASASTFTFANEPASEHTISGNIGVVSQYILRGNTINPENDNATVQAGIDYSHSSGFYAGYWGSTLGYSLENSSVDFEYLDPTGATQTVYKDGTKSFENDFYLGYNGKINEDLGYTIGAIYYLYYGSDVDSDFAESMLGLNYKDFSLTAQTVLQDSAFGNTGDTYFLGSYSYALPKDFTLNSSIGLYYNSDSGDYESDLNTTEDFNFRHFNVGLSHPLGDTGATVAMDFVAGGKLRDDTNLKNKVVFGLKYEF